MGYRSTVDRACVDDAGGTYGLAGRAVAVSAGVDRPSAAWSRQRDMWVGRAQRLQARLAVLPALQWLSASGHGNGESVAPPSFGARRVVGGSAFAECRRLLPVPAAVWHTRVVCECGSCSRSIRTSADSHVKTRRTSSNSTESSAHALRNASGPRRRRRGRRSSSAAAVRRLRAALHHQVAGTGRLRADHPARRRTLRTPPVLSAGGRWCAPVERIHQRCQSRRNRRGNCRPE